MVLRNGLLEQPLEGGTGTEFRLTSFGGGHYAQRPPSCLGQRRLPAQGSCGLSLVGGVGCLTWGVETAHSLPVCTPWVGAFQASNPTNLLLNWPDPGSQTPQ